MIDFGNNGIWKSKDGQTKNGITYMILEYCENGALFDILTKKMPEHQKKRYIL